MKDKLKLNCGCTLAFSDSYPHLIFIGKCSLHKYDKSLDIILDAVNNLLSLVNLGVKIGDVKK